MMRVGHVARVGIQNAYITLVVKPEGKRLMGSHWRIVYKWNSRK
jgi:hypothetical protein